LAIASLVTSILLLPPVGLALAIAAIARLRKSDEQGWGLVYGALAVCLGWLALVVLFLAVGFSGGFDYHSRGPLAHVALAETGTCLQEDPPKAVECSTAHDFEIYFTAVLPDPVWPGSADLAAYADTLCDEAFEGYVGSSVSSSDYGYDFYAPTRKEWDGGKHNVVCVVTTSKDFLTGSVKGSGR
jgi:hypothetical protein